MKSFPLLMLLPLFLLNTAVAQQNPQVTISNGQLQGTYDASTSIYSYKGIPYALPPVGNLRWKEPQPPANWSGVLKADHFSHMPMQKRIYSDMIFRADTMSEDCLYLNVWAPAQSAGKKLPVLVYFYGGGFVAGDGSESRYDGESLAQKGIVTITISYRLGIFGFFAHPELTKESPHNASGNYGLLDQHAALLWVKANIATFGGDPEKVTIAGESAGSFSVCAQVLSPLSKGLFSGAIGESGGFSKMNPLSSGENSGLAFAKSAGVNSLADLRALSASQLLDLASKPGAWRFPSLIDGYFFTKQPIETLEAGEEMHVPVLVGWNSAEVPYQAFTGGDMPIPENYAKKIKQRYGADSATVLKLFPGNTQDEVIKSATALASDNFIVYGTWKWADMQAKTSGNPVYRYIFSCPRPPEVGKTAETPGKLPPAMVGASHASEIEFALGNLSSNKVYAWTPDDYKVSATMEEYFANFIKTGNPNGKGLPKWKPNTKGSRVNYMDIDVKTQLEPETEGDRFLFLDKLNTR
ncbi:MAG TPA: carboxylesterase family protein [Mucilaginibacter sp.]|jgi:para-nitrobenzyl esterase|nr:carboxylesterase family protein [Mucilaginibacter sp.]